MDPEFSGARMGANGAEVSGRRRGRSNLYIELGIWSSGRLIGFERI
jgi:hypothetical protein